MMRLRRTTRCRLHFAPINGPQAVPFDQVNGQDVNFDGKSDATDRYLARQLLARHLYVLMMLCADDQFKFPLSTIPASPGNQVPQWGMPTEGLSPQQRSELKAKRLAQWAVNVVDFMDSDNIMTGFEFDMNPFNGWEVDSNLTTPDDPAAAKGERGMTFGCEMPVAILTETLAFHARRVQDTEHDDGTESKREDMNNPDPTLDQALIPRGSAFVEIMAIFNANVGVMSGDLFVFEQNEWKLDLGKMAPAGPLGPAKPVWRLAVTDFHTPHETDTSAEREPVSDIVSEHPDTVSLQPFVETDWGTIQPPAMSRWNLTLLNQMPDRHNLPIERIVWMASAAPQGPEAAYTFHALTNANARLGGFQYAVVGPGGTGAGDRTSGTVNGITIGWRSDDQVAQTQQISIEGAVSVQRTEKTYPAVGTAIKPALGIPVASPAGQVKTWDAERPWGANIRVGFSISEPLFSDATHYYPRPSETNADTGLQEAYGDEADDTKKYLDKPLDSEIQTNPAGTCRSRNATCFRRAPT